MCEPVEVVVQELLGVAAGLLLDNAVSKGLVRLPVPTDLVILMLACSVLNTITATLVTAWAASGEKPIHALRYE